MHYLSVADISDVNALVEDALKLKAQGADRTLGAGKTLLLIFFNPSLRTRLSTEKAGRMLGMDVITMNATDAWGWELEDGAVMNADKPEHIKDAARVVSTYADIIGIRSFPTLKDREADYQDRLIRTFAQHATVPVISLESSVYHPCQSLADLITMREHASASAKRPFKIAATWAPHPKALPQAVMNSFLTFATAAGHDVTLAHPPGYELAEQMTAGCTVTHDQEAALRDADFVYVKNWSSYSDYGQVLSQDSSWMIDAHKMALTNNAGLLHCLPVRRNVVIADDALDAERSLVIPQAGNRVTAAAAVLERMLRAAHEVH